MRSAVLLCIGLLLVVTQGCGRGGNGPGPGGKGVTLSPEPEYADASAAPAEWRVTALPCYHLDTWATSGFGDTPRRQGGAAGDGSPTPAVIVRSQIQRAAGGNASVLWPGAAGLELLRGPAPAGPYRLVTTVRGPELQALAFRRGGGNANNPQPLMFHLVDPTAEPGVRYCYRLRFVSAKGEPLALSGVVTGFAVAVPEWQVNDGGDGPGSIHFTMAPVAAALVAAPPRWSVVNGNALVKLQPLSVTDYAFPATPNNVAIGLHLLCRVQSWSLTEGTREEATRIAPGDQLLTLHAPRDLPGPAKPNGQLTPEERQARRQAFQERRQQQQQARKANAAVLIETTSGPGPAMNLGERRADSYYLRATFGSNTQLTVLEHDRVTGKTDQIGWEEVRKRVTPGARDYTVAWVSDGETVEAKLSAVCPPRPGPFTLAAGRSVALQWSAPAFDPADWTEGPFVELYRSPVSLDADGHAESQVARRWSYSQVHFGPATETAWTDDRAQPGSTYAYVLVFSGLVKAAEWHQAVGTHPVDMPVFAPQLLSVNNLPTMVTAGNGDTPSSISELTVVAPPVVTRDNPPRVFPPGRSGQDKNTGPPTDDDIPVQIEESRTDSLPNNPAVDLAYHWVDLWEHRYHLSPPADMAADVDGNIYLVGAYHDSVDLAPGPAVAPATTYGSTDLDIYVTKLDRTGTHIWTHTFGSLGFDVARCLLVDGRSGVIVAGGYHRAASISATRPKPTLPAGTELPASEEGGIFLARFSADGRAVWSRTFAGKSADVQDVARGPDNRLLMVGSFSGELRAGGGTYTAEGDGAAFLMTLDTAGKPLRTVTFGGRKWIRPNDVWSDAKGHIWVAGQFGGTIDFNPGKGEQFEVGAGSAGTFLSQYDADCTWRWTRTRLGGRAASLPPDRAVVVNHAASRTHSSFTLICVGADGKTVWERKVAADTHTLCPDGGIAVDSHGEIYVGGYYQRTVDFDPGEGQDLGAPPIRHLNNLFVTRYGIDGQYRWTVTFTDAFLKQVVVTPDNSLLFSGYFNGWQDFDPGRGSAVRETRGDTPFLVKWGARPPQPGVDVPLPPPPRETLPVIALDRREPDDGPGTDGGLLLRELCRQAFLIAARDELGLATRDAALREYDPQQPGKLRTYSMYTFAREGDHAGAAVGGSDTPYEELTRVSTPFGKLVPGYLQLVSSAAGWSQLEFAKLLKEQGLTRVERPAPATLPQYREAMAQFTFISQYQAVRALHQLVAVHPDDVSLQGELARAYANLGMLTQFHWSPSSKVFAARSLLYVERAILDHVPTEGLLYDRAYVRAMAGFLSAAKDDLDTADKLAGDADRPPWAPVIRAWCGYDCKALETLAQNNPDQAPLALLLRCLIMEHGYPDVATIESCQQLLAIDPECYRVHAITYESGGIGSLHMSTQLPVAILMGSLEGRLSALPGLPATLAAPLARPITAPDRETAIVEALVAADQAGLDASPAPADPTWTLLGRLIEDTAFVQIQQRGAFMRDAWGVPTEDFVAEMVPMAASHPYANVLKSYGFRAGSAEARRLLLSVEITDYTLDMCEIYYLTSSLNDRGSAVGKPGLELATRHADATDRDLVLILAQHPRKEFAIAVAHTLNEVSPGNPAGYTALIDADWQAMKDSVAELKQRFADNPAFLSALAHKYLTIHDGRQFLATMDQLNKLAPSIENYQLLGRYYLESENYPEWIATMDKIIAMPGIGLEGARAAVRVANHYIRKNDFVRAEPYATRAAQSWAQWAMVSAIECYFGLGDTARAERMLQALSSRYDTDYHTWWAYCVRTGNGGAQQAAARFPLQLAKGSASEAPYYLLTGQLAKAVPLLENTRQWTANEMLMGAMLAWQLGDTAKRDLILKEIAVRPKIGVVQFAELAGPIANGLKAGTPLDPKMITGDLGVLRGMQCNYYACDYLYIIALYAELTGHHEDAVARMTDAVKEPMTFSWTSTGAALAATWLREHQQPVPTPQYAPPPGKAD